MNSLFHHFSNFDFRAAVIIIFGGNAAPDGFSRAPVIAGQAVFATMQPDRFVIRQRYVIDRADSGTDAAAGTFFSDAEANIIEMNELMHVQSR